MNQVSRPGQPQQRPHFFEQMGFSGIIVVPNLGPIAANTEGASQLVTWPGGDWLVHSMFAGTVDGDPKTLSKIGLQLAVTNDAQLVTDGSTAAYAPLAAFQPQLGAWLKLQNLPVVANQRWQCRFKNLSADGPFTPYLLFGLRKANG